MVICRPYQLSEKNNWDNFIENSKTPIFFFKRDFMEYHADRYVDASLMFYIDDTLMAVLPASHQDQILCSHGGLTYGGFILNEKVRASTIQDLLNSLVNYTRTTYKKIQYKTIPYIFHNYGSQEDLYFLTNSLNAKIYRRDLSSIIYLKNRIKLSKGRKWLIARAKKLGLEVTTSNDWSTFHTMLTNVLKKYDTTPVHTADELIYLSNLFPQNIQLKIIEKYGSLLAAAVLFKFNSVMHTQYLATSEEGKECGALDFLVEDCIQESILENLDYFSFGISTELQGKILNQGLIAQKENFGARGMVLDFYEIPLND